MNPFDRASRPREDEELVSPKGTRFQNYNALLNNNLPVQSNERVEQGESNDSYLPLHAVSPLHNFTKVRQLSYTGSVLGKRPINAGYNPPWMSKRRRTEFESSDRPQIPFMGDFVSASDPPNHVKPQNVGHDDFSRKHFAHKVYRADPYLSRLPLTAEQFNAFIRPPEPLEDWALIFGSANDWHSTFGLGNDWPPASFENINPLLVHPILRQLVSARDRDPYTDETTFPRHEECPELWRALMLATHFLSNTHTLAFFHKILFQEPELLEPESRFYGVPIHHFPLTTPIDTNGLTEDQRMRTSEALCALAAHINIFFGSLYSEVESDIHYTRTFRSGVDPVELNPGQLTATVLPSASHSPKSIPQAQAQPAQTLTDFHGMTSQQVAALGFRGTNAVIKLPYWFREYLESDSSEDAYGNPKPDYQQPHCLGPPFYERQYALFFMAVTIVREIAHAVWLCRWGQAETEPSNEYEPFVGEMRRADLGRAWECSVLGGTIKVLAWDALYETDYLHQCDDESGNRLAMGLGLKMWPDKEERLVDSRYYEMPVPLARVLDRGDMMDFDVNSGVAAVQAQVANTANGGPGTKALRLPVVQSADRWEYLRVMPFEFAAQFFQERVWKWADGSASASGEKSGFKQWIDTQVQSWPLAVRENPSWGHYGILRVGARPADWDAELEAIQKEVDMESDCSDGPGY